MKAKMILVLCLIVVVMLTGCAAPNEQGQVPGMDIITVVRSANSYTGEVYRFVDNEAGVACWVYTGFKEGGISCLPLIETRLSGQ